MHEFDFHYQQDNYFGEANKKVLEYFSKTTKGRVLDLGCGQGRNALPLAKMGFEVTGIDISVVGINKMIDKARRQNLNIHAIVSDMFAFPLEQNFDVVLMDSVLNFKPEEKAKEIEFLNQILDKIQVNSRIVICFWDSLDVKNILIYLFEKHKAQWKYNISLEQENQQVGNEIISFQYYFVDGIKTSE